METSYVVNACNTKGKESALMLETPYICHFIIVSNHQQTV